MNRFKIDKFVQEFPFVPECLPSASDLVSPHSLDNISVKRVDENLLQKMPRNHTWDGSLVDRQDKEIVSFVLSDGSVIFFAVRQDEKHGSNYAYSQTVRHTGERIIDAIYGYQVADKLAFIVVYLYYHDDTSGSDLVTTRSLTIYKAERGATIAAIAAEVKRAATEVKAESEF